MSGVTPWQCLPLPSMNDIPYDPLLMQEIEMDMLRLRAARERAEELVRDRGWKEADDDFWFQVEDETKRQWDEDVERDLWKRHRLDEPMDDD